MQAKAYRILPALTAALLLAACASDNGPGALSTSSLTSAPTPVAAARPKVDPQCVALASQIEAIRREGTIDRLEKSATGKGASVQVKRNALAKQAELNKANVEFQVKCAPRIPTTNEAAAPATTTVAAAAPVAAKAASAAAKAAPKMTPAAIPGVTVVPSTPKAQ